MQDTAQLQFLQALAHTLRSLTAEEMGLLRALFDEAPEEEQCAPPPPSPSE